MTYGGEEMAEGGEGGNQSPTRLQGESFVPFYLVSEAHA